MAPTIQNCCFLITGAVLGALIPSTVPYILELLPFGSLGSLVVGIKRRYRATPRPWAPLENLPLEVLEQVLFYCHADDVARVALTSPRLAYLTRRYRWNKVTIKAGEPYYSFREWSLQAAMTGTKSLRSLQIVIPGLDITFPLCQELRRDFCDFVRESSQA
ncbi:hypothetical protein EV122DRAFT_283424 [Schizophyllum commune]